MDSPGHPNPHHSSVFSLWGKRWLLFNGALSFWVAGFIKIIKTRKAEYFLDITPDLPLMSTLTYLGLAL
jgi:hypothetical protein